MNNVVVSAIIVALNEEKYIEKSLYSLINQDFDKANYEIIVVDSMSTDLTVSICKGIMLKNKNLKLDIKIITNEKRYLASGWNKAILESQGKYVVRIDAHSTIPTNYISRCYYKLLELEDKGVVCVGGRLNYIPSTYFSNISKNVLTSPFGVGGAKFRYSKTSGFVDTVAYGLYAKEAFLNVGLLNEDLHRTQDNDLHRKIRKAGGKFYLISELEIEYFPRDKFKKFVNQAFLNGYWIMKNFIYRPGKISVRHFVPLFFTLFVFSIVLYPIIPIEVVVYYSWIYLSVLLVYSFLAIIFSYKNSGKFVVTFLSFPMFFVLHFCYGIGSLVALFHKNKKEAKDE